MEARYLVARYTASVLHALATGGVVPEVPSPVEDSIRERLTLVRSSSIELVRRYGVRRSVPGGDEEVSWPEP